MVTKPVFAAQNSVNPYGIYIFLAKDLHMSKLFCNFAAVFVSCIMCACAHVYDLKVDNE